MTRVRISQASGSATGAGPSNHNADTPLPSVEGASPGTSSDTGRSVAFRREDTPSVSVSPPPSSSSRTEPADTPSSSSRRSGSSSIDVNLQELRLGTSEGPLANLADLSAATTSVAQGSDHVRAVLLTPDPSPGGRRRRRSSSAVDQSPHNVADEQLPEDAFFSPTFQRAIADARGLMGWVAEALGSSAIHEEPDSVMKRLHGEAHNLSRYQGPQSRTVAFVGDSGVGKSSLLNSLLDFPGLARTSNSGQACTCVVTEYHYHEANHFDVEVEFFSEEDIADQLAEMLQLYRHFHLHGDEIREDGERIDVEERATLARDTFRAMFQGQLEDEAFLTEWPEDTALDTLKTWALESRPRAVHANMSEMNLQECSQHLMKISSDPIGSQAQAFWPYINKVKVFSKAFILSKGLILVDLPGLRDLNSARRNITERFLLECDEIFVICNIGRAITDAGVASVFDLAEKAQLSNVGIICTRSDDIDAEESRRDWKGETARRVRDYMEAVQTAQRECEQIEAELADFADEDDLLEEERDQERELHRRLRNTVRRRKMRQFELNRYLITTRNEVVTTRLRAMYASRVSTGDIKVFCTSNTLYWEYRSRPREEGLQGLNLSGILAVRRSCIAIVADSQRRAATRYIRDQIPALLAQLQLWVQSGAGTAGAEHKEAVRKVLGDLEAVINELLSPRISPVGSFGKMARRDFENTVYYMSIKPASVTKRVELIGEQPERREITNWTRAAQQAGRVWGGWHWASYAAFCRNFGDHCTAAIGPRNWNEEVIEAMSRDLSEPFQAHTALLEEEWQKIQELVEAVAEDALDMLEDESQEVSVALTPLTQALTNEQHQLMSNLGQVYATFTARLHTLRTNALSGIRTSLIGQALSETYRACNMEYGTGSHARRKNIMDRALGREALFDNLMFIFKNTYQTHVTELQRGIDTAVDEYLNVVRGTLDIIRDENVAEESEKDPEFRGRVESEVASAQAAIAQIQIAIGDA